MVRKKDIVKVFVIYLSLCHVCPAHPCGENPLRRLISISVKTGHPLRSVLLALREMNGVMYKELQNNFQRYAGCIGIVDTGYFKRSAALVSPYKRTLDNDNGHIEGLDLFKTWIKRDAAQADRLSLLKETEDLLDNELYPFSRPYEKDLITNT
ncbi:uncharacterized protein LOC133171683 [Saccostrea echinata]|uniref:uncharacterized protein LOC133171683 n=1 Tax=Saccostrea echinata TaxID=191078 RepID=UPI002A81318E|nr:uncharacterized protein LOC133171683 [Saccostrea echinata]